MSDGSPKDDNDNPVIDRPGLTESGMLMRNMFVIVNCLLLCSLGSVCHAVAQLPLLVLVLVTPVHYEIWKY